MSKLVQFSFVLLGLTLILSLVHIVPSDAAGKKPDGKKPAGKPGAKLSAKKAPDDRVKQIVQQLDSEIREKICGLSPDMCGLDSYSLVAQGYKKQVLVGNNYFISVSLKDKFYHCRVYEESWNDVLELVDVQGPKGRNDEIKYF